jgi:hypothetical protein
MSIDTERENKTVPVMVRMTPTDRAMLDRMRIRRRRSVSNYLAWLIEEDAKAYDLEHAKQIAQTAAHNASGSP